MYETPSRVRLDMCGENVDVWRVASFTKQIRILQIRFLSVLINTDARLIKLKPFFLDTNSMCNLNYGM